MSNRRFCEHEMFAVSCEICVRDRTITALRAENERLRAALEDAYQFLGGVDGAVEAREKIIRVLDCAALGGTNDPQ